MKKKSNTNIKGERGKKGKKEWKRINLNNEKTCRIVHVGREV